ncbi:hypothetical protein PMAYCL1PPCAC_08023, partial [Pristionchus mayeri]
LHQVEDVHDCVRPDLNCPFLFISCQFRNGVDPLGEAEVNGFLKNIEALLREIMGKIVDVSLSQLVEEHLHFPLVVHLLEEDCHCLHESQTQNAEVVGLHVILTCGLIFGDPGEERLASRTMRTVEEMAEDVGTDSVEDLEVFSPRFSEERHVLRVRCPGDFLFLFSSPFVHLESMVKSW